MPTDSDAANDFVTALDRAGLLQLGEPPRSSARGRHASPPIAPADFPDRLAARGKLTDLASAQPAR